jgi:hypothetical protein
MTFPNKWTIPTKNKELSNLIWGCYDKMKYIHENFSEDNLDKIKYAHEEIYGLKNWDWIYEGWKIHEIKEAYQIILNDDSDSETIWLKPQIENILSDIEDNKITKIDDYLEKIEGKLEENENWERIKKEGLFDKINDLYKTYNKRLQWADTALELAWIFETKVSKYYKEWIFWNRVFFIVLITFITLLYISAYNLDLEYKKVLLNLVRYLPFIAFSIWWLVFIWNRRAEAKKLEESYKHKEVMARAYIWYKESVSELDTNDNQLIEKHMENLLSAMSVNSSDFLSSNWENHPFIDLIKNWKNINKDSIKEILSDFNIDISIKK